MKTLPGVSTQDLRARRARGRDSSPLGWRIVALVLAMTVGTHAGAKEDEQRSDDIEIVHDDDRTIFEYRRNGVVLIIKVVPKKGRPYYMVPADGNTEFRSLEHSKKLYPQWVILEW